MSARAPGWPENRAQEPPEPPRRFWVFVASRLLAEPSAGAE